MTNFDFKSTKVFFMCTVDGDGVTINNISFTTINVELLTNAELLTLAKGVYFGHLITNDNSAFETYYTDILGDITSNGGVGGSVSPEIVQDIVGGMFDEGILITSDYNDTTGKIQLTPLPGVFTKDFIDRTYGAAHVYGGLITPTGGVNFSIASGGGYARNIDGEIVFVEWTNKTGSCAADGNNFIGIDSDGNVIQSTSQFGPDIIALGYINTALGNTTVTGYSNINHHSTDASYWVNQWVRNAVGANVEFGCNIASLPSPNDLSIVMGSGRIWAQFNQIDLLDKYNFTKIYGTTAGFIPNTLDPNVVDPNYINDRNQAPGSALIPMTTGYFKKDMVFTMAEGNLYYVYATSEWPTLEEAQKAPLPEAPSSIRAQIIRLAGIVLEEGATVIADIMDIRPMFSRLFETGTSAIPSTAISHSDLTDLGVDSHTQYHNDARGDIRYYRKIEVDTLLSSKSDTGHSHSDATGVTSGFMSSADKSKLDAISSGATANATDVYLLSRSNHTGTQDVSTITGLTKASVGLGNVDNTADVDKPISTAVQTALNGKSNTGHTHIIADVTGLQTALDGKEPVVASGTTSQFYRGDKTFTSVTKANVGLSNVQDVDTTTTANIVDSTNKRFVSDANLVVIGNTSGANSGDETQSTIKTKLGFATAIVDGYLKSADFATFNAKEPAIAAGTTGQYYRGDKTFQTLDKTAVGLANVDNTSDANKPISTATQTALNAKKGTIAAGTVSQYYRGDKSWQTLDKAAVGLSNVDNTSDANKPISTATQTALNGKEATVAAGTVGQYYRGDKTWQTLDKTAVGLDNVDNTSDVDKPISTATQTALDGKISGAVNVGAGAGVYKDTVANNLRFKSIVAGTTKGISIAENADDITLDNKFAKHPQNIYITEFDDFYTAQPTPFLQSAAAGIGAGIVRSGQPVFGGTDKRFGIGVCSTGITSTGYAGGYGIYATPNFGNLVDGDYIEFSTSLRVPTLSAGGDRFTVYAGFTDQTTGIEGVDGAYFKYSDNLSGGKFQVVTSNNSTRTIADSGITVVANTDYTLRVRVKNVGGTISANFYINGTAVATNVTTNLPITSLRTTSMAVFIVKSVGTTNRTLESDWVYFEYKTSRNITL